MPTCTVSGCDTEILGLDDGWEYSRGLVCDSCIEFNKKHGHWPDEDQRCPHCIDGDDL